MLAGAEPWMPDGCGPRDRLPVAFPIPGHELRRAAWQRELSRAGEALDEQDLEVLAGRYRLTPGQIVASVAGARARAGWRAAARSSAGDSEGEGRPAVPDFSAAARAQSGHALGALARKIEPGPDVDLDLLAREIKLAGGHLKNIALAAAFAAAADGGPIRLAHLARAARREHQKLGRTWDEAGLTAPGAGAA